MKRVVKELFPAVILAIAISFMFFIYEPIILYTSNINDFWFDIYTMFSYNILFFLIFIVAITILYIVVYFVENIFIKDKKIVYNAFLIIGYIGFIITYIQGNYLASNLPLLDGTTIVWREYKIHMVISAVLLLMACIVAIVCTIKFKYKKVINILKYVTIAILCMLSVSILSNCVTTNCFIRKDYPATATTKNLNKYSTDKNFIIFLLDAVDSQRTNDIIEESDEYKAIFNDFTYYPDTVSGYVFTRDSIPLILTGNWNENKTEFSNFSNDAMRNSQLFDMLKENGYDTNIYETELTYNSNDTCAIENLSFDAKLDKTKFFKEEFKYILFKYLPYYLKQLSKAETIDFYATKSNCEDDIFKLENIEFYNNYLEQNIEAVSDKQFKFIHIEGGHTPFDCDENLEPINYNGTYEQKVKGCLKIVSKYLNYLKENNMYDNSVIIIMADHGYEYEYEATIFRQNPIFYVKGINEKHELKISNEKISYGDLMEIYKNLLQDKSTDKLLDNVDTTKERRLLLHETYNYNHMTEYFQTGKSRDYYTSILSGNEFNLED